MTTTNFKYEYNNKMLKEFINLWKADSNPKKPKRLFQKGFATDKALAYNRQLIKENKTSYYLKPNTVINKNTGREITTHLTKTGKLKASFKKKFELFGNVLAPKRDTKVYTYYMAEQKDEVWDGDNIMNNYLLQWLTDGLNGNYRIIIKVDGVGVVSDNSYPIYMPNWFSEFFDSFRVGSSPIVMNWQGFQTNISDGKKDSTYYPTGTKIQIIITKEKLLPQAFYSQKYKLGLTNCLLTPIKDYFEQKTLDSKSKTTKYRNQQTCLELQALMNKNPEGFNDTMVQKICDQFQIRIKLIQPFSKHVYLDCESMKKPRKIFTFLNSLLDHVEHIEKNYDLTDATFVKSFDPEIRTPDELRKIEKGLNEYYVYGKSSFGISSIRTLTNYYKIDDSFNIAKREFETITGIQYWGFDALKYPQLMDFINKGTHFNGTVDFKDTIALREVGKNDKPPEDIEHIDIRKAYSKFYKTKYYDGFMGKVQIFRECNNDDEIGMYFITDLDFTQANNKFIRLNEKMKIYFSNNIYTSPELKFLRDLGCTFKITHGCFNLDKEDIRFNDEMLNNKEEIMVDGYTIRNVSYYAKYCGYCASLRPYQSWYMKGNKKLLQTIQTSNELKIYENEIDDENRIQMKKETLNSKKHFTAQILAYQRIIMLEQLLKLDIDKIIRVCVDGIYYEKHDYINRDLIKSDKCDLWASKKEMTFKNYPDGEFISSIVRDVKEFDLVKGITKDLGIVRKDYEHELHDGAGGSGKTYYNLIKDKGLIHPCYVAMSWKLCSDMAKDYYNKTGQKLTTMCLERILVDKGCNNHKKYGTYIIDECSMLTEHQKQELLEKLPKTIFIGDLQCQLKPIITPSYIDNLLKTLQKPTPNHIPSKYTRQMNQTDFDNVIIYDKIWRFKEGDKLHDIARYLRKNIRNWEMDYKTLDIQKISRNEVKNYYNHKEDMIIGANKFDHAFYKEEFKDFEKYKITQNTKDYKNGEIVYEDIKEISKEFRHCFTVHSVQGLTFEGKLFIDMKSIIDPKMFYTAISRARSVHQIYLVI
jgi:hypothetical protein